MAMITVPAERPLERTTEAWYVPVMSRTEAIEQISQLLSSDMTQTSNTSMRIPVALRDAAILAARELGAAQSATALTIEALQATLEETLMRAALDDHYERYPESRPDLGDLAIAVAEQEGHPLATQPERLRQAAVEVSARRASPEPEDVVLWAEARSLPAA